MRKVLLTLMVLSFLFILLGLSNQKADAIPAFARKYKTACITCHATYPRLTALGEAFRLNGYKMPGDDELYVKDEPRVLGAEAYKNVFPDAVWPSDMPGMPPVALRLITDYEVDIGGTKDSRTDFRIDAAKILGAGSFGQDMSFFVEIEYEEAELEIEAETEPVGSGGEDVVTEIEVEEFESGTEFSGWLLWEDLLFGDNYLNLRLGTIGMQDLALPNTRSHNRISVQDYLYTDALNLHAHGNDAVGVEINGFGKSWRYNLGVLNGDGATSRKDYYGALSFKIGGLGYDGSGGFTEEGALTSDPAGYWRDDSVLFGLFAYRSNVGAGNIESDRFGADVRVNYKDLSFAVGYIDGDDIAGHGHGGSVELADKEVFFAEAEYFILPWIQSYVRYENLDVDAQDPGDQARVVLGSVLLARANVKFNVEGTFYTDNDPREAAGGDKNDDDRLVLRLDYAF